MGVLQPRFHPFRGEQQLGGRIAEIGRITRQHGPEPAAHDPVGLGSNLDRLPLPRLSDQEPTHPAGKGHRCRVRRDTRRALTLLEDHPFHFHPGTGRHGHTGWRIRVPYLAFMYGSTSSAQTFATSDGSGLMSAQRM